MPLMSKTGQAAIKYAERGLAVFAPAWGSKVPNKDTSGIIGRTSATATKDLDKLARIYEDKPGNNVSIRLDQCDPPLVAIDCENAKAHPTADEKASGTVGEDGWDVLDEWLDENGVQLPPTWTIHTASGGINRIYLLPDGENMPKTETSVLLRVDLLGAGQPLTMPPSVINGKSDHYRWEDGCSPDDLEPAVLPMPLLDYWWKVTKEREEQDGGKGAGTHSKPSRRAKGDGVAISTMQGRNKSLFSYGCSLRACGADDDEVSAKVHAENIKRFAADPLPDREVDGIVTSVLKYPRGDGRKKRLTQGDVALRFRGDERIYGKFGTNLLDGGCYVRGRLPWTYGPEYRRWNDADEAYLFIYAQEQMDVTSRADVTGAFKVICAENSFNPIADMLDALPKWDGTPRAELMLWALFGTLDTPYTRAVSALWMRGAVRRAYEPGCKFDYTLVLRGAQGIKKSLTGRRLAMAEEFFCETVTDITDAKTTSEQIGGKWIVELGELAGIKGKELEAVKAALTAQKITVRQAYAHFPIDQPRSCVFIATTNERNFLTDPTGNRRFLPVECDVEKDRKGWDTASTKELREFIEQAWAEIVGQYKRAKAAATDENGELDEDTFLSLYPLMPDSDLERLANKEREAVSIEDTRIGIIEAWLESKKDAIPARVCTRMVAEEALGLNVDTLEKAKYVMADIGNILDDFCPGWVRAEGKKRCGRFGVVRVWDYVGDAQVATLATGLATPVATPITAGQEDSSAPMLPMLPQDSKTFG